MNRNWLALVMVLLSQIALSQTLTELQTFRGSDTPNGSGNVDMFGSEIALSGNTLVVSAPAHNDFGGAAYVFELNGSNQWTQVAKLTASDAAIDQSFGHSIAIENNVIVIGAPGVNRTDQGVYIFEKPGAGWTNMTETIKLNTPYTISSLSGFGFSVDIQNDEIMVGAPYEDNGAIVAAGRIYVYEKSGVSWTTAFVRAELTTTNVGNGDLIGYSAVFGDNFIVTGAITGSTAGTLHVFEKPSSGSWANATIEDIILFGSDRSALDGFGGVVATNGDFISSIGAFDGNINSDMIVYIFERQNSKWSDQSTQNESILANLPSYFPFQGFNNSHSVTALEFQSNLLLNGNGRSTGPTLGNTTPSGSVFIRNSKTGSLVIEIDGLDYNATGRFGSAIAIDGSRLLISSPQEATGGVVRYFDLSYDLSVSRQLCSGGSISFGTQTITSMGTYQEQFTSSNGLDSLVNLTVTNTDLAINALKSDLTCTGTNDGEITISNTGGMSPFEYSLDGVSYNSQNVFSNLVPGSYDAYVRDVNGCIASTTIIISEPDELVISPSKIDASCFGQSDGTILVSATGGTSPYMYSLDGTTFTGSTVFASLFAGNYTVYLQDGNGCTDSGSVTISEPDEVLTPSVSDATAVYGGRTTSGLIISPSPSDGSITHYQITNILGGILFKSDGSTEVSSGDFISVAEGNNGLVFAPAQAGTGSFQVQASASDQAACLGGNLVTATISVSKAALECTANETIAYGDAIPSLNIQYGGFVNGDDASDIDTEPSVTTTASQFDDAGNYTISLSGGSDDNYNLILINGTLTIEKASLTATADDVTILVDESIPALTWSYSGFVNGESATVLDMEPTISTTASEGVLGTYPITLSGGADNNYDFDLVNGTLTIQQVLSIDDNSVLIYPNPAKDQLTIRGVDIAEVKVLALDGKVLNRSENSNRIDIATLKTGLYILWIRTRSGDLLTHPFVKDN